MKIRSATIDDASSIARVTVDTWRSAYRGLIDQEYLDGLSYENREQGWREFPFDNAFVYVAEDETGNIIGFAAAGPERENNPIYTGELYALYVYDNHQNQDIGSSLFNAVRQRFKKLGISSLLLWALSDSPYRRFYEREGGVTLKSKALNIDGLDYMITAYGWLDI